MLAILNSSGYHNDNTVFKVIISDCLNILQMPPNTSSLPWINSVLKSTDTLTSLETANATRLKGNILYPNSSYASHFKAAARMDTNSPEYINRKADQLIVWGPPITEDESAAVGSRILNALEEVEDGKYFSHF
jgi:hypothetical protein